MFGSLIGLKGYIQVQIKLIQMKVSRKQYTNELILLNKNIKHAINWSK